VDPAEVPPVAVASPAGSDAPEEQAQAQSSAAPLVIHRKRKRLPKSEGCVMGVLPVYAQ
jgi:hypothetical protein